jgi:hypothetical protein
VLAALVLAGCPFYWNLPENTIIFTLDGTEYSYSASWGPSPTAYGLGESSGGAEPYGYYITASLNGSDASQYHNTIVIEISSEVTYSGQVIVYDEEGIPLYFNLGTFTRTELEQAIKNIDSVQEQMRAGFEGPFTDTGLGTRTLENLAFSVERLADSIPSSIF